MGEVSLDRLVLIVSRFASAVGGDLSSKASLDVNSGSDSVLSEAL